MLNPGDTLNNRYRVTKWLGIGGMGETWMVEDTQDFTLKVVKILTNHSEKAVNLFMREAKVLQELRHSGIPRVENDGSFTQSIGGIGRPWHFLVMEYIEGKNLQTWLEEQPEKIINFEQAIDWLKQLVEILDLVHEQGYFHRDLKPTNIMCKPNGQLVLIDFGGVKEITELERTGTALLSKGYTSPEQLKGLAIPQSDFFALGRTFVYLLTGQAPIKFCPDPYGLEINPNWRESVPRLPDSLANLIDELMAYVPEERPENTQIILQRLALISIQSAIEPIINQIQIPGIQRRAREILQNTYQQWIEQRRIPIIGLYGRTNSGKSSLINAIMGKEVARVGTGVRPTTADHESFQCSQNGWKRKFIDSRGVGEKYQKKSDEEAFQQAIKKIVQEKIDILLFVVLALEVGYSEQDVAFLEALKKAHQQTHNTELPILLVINKIDQVAEPDEWSPPYNLNLDPSTDDPDSLTEHEDKEFHIRECIKQRLLQYQQLTQDYIPVCTYWNWKRKRGKIYNIEELEEKMQALINNELVKYSFNQSSSFSKLRRDVAYNFCEAAAQLSWFIFLFPKILSSLQRDLVILVKSLADQEGKKSFISVDKFWSYVSKKQITNNKISASARTFQIGKEAIRCFFDQEDLEQVKQQSLQENQAIESDLQKAYEQGGEEEVMNKLKQKYQEMQRRYGLRGIQRNISNSH